MLYKLLLKNCSEEVLLSEETYRLITENPEYAAKKIHAQQWICFLSEEPSRT
jgi:hypothetical protein